MGSFLQPKKFKDQVELIAMEWKPGRAGSMFTIGVTRGNRRALLAGFLRQPIRPLSAEAHSFLGFI